ncbi:MAG: hypothetical protein COY66_02425 [Candidatus Kerfeldbacteria bacterium CG_4_10_14_0_8_um_filter_42_10]|uniref:SIS domain-containing protein n=1 Tax=Candidatus Kerfeldbacteria bacterium CG_4_10_14_0_8_um_filter_42_10 TaxID=2014248 RepID=A0A2M7RJW1_9BACT|nr:MAG: hypothetical protein COY66_02425 [Candidatus Kerfeldbacteria bacterium CG_4_10_14_0_8_um_filter_42_10]
MNILDQISQINRLDRNKMRTSLESLEKQCRQAWREVKKVRIPPSYRKAKNILISGMGGSALGGQIIQSLFYNQLKVPLQVINNYSLPASLSSDTLCLFSSYSGTTEETLTAARLALQKKVKILGITTNGRLARFLKKQKLPGYVFNPIHNPCGEPRMGVGYSVMGQIGLLKKCGFLKVSDAELRKVIKLLEKVNQRFKISHPAKNNPAKKIALACYDKTPLLVGSEFLIANAHTFANQINENGKNFATYFAIPELNHHLLEGLKNPSSNKSSLLFLFIESDLYHPRVKIRYAITRKVIQKHKISTLSYKSKAKTKIEQVFEILSLGGYVSYYLALLNKTNPALIPWVDYFKEELKKYK